MDPGWTKHLREHYEGSWGTSGRRIEWSRGPIHSACPDFHGLAVKRSVNSAAIASIGMSLPGDASPLELHMLLKPAWSRPSEREVMELMAAVAHYHRTETVLDVGHTVNFGRPW